MTTAGALRRPLALVFGASGQIGMPLQARLRALGWDVVGVTRSLRTDAPGLTWRQGGFADVDGLPAAVDAIFSCGPLDAFAQWYALAQVIAPRVVAFGSTSIGVKADSADAHERDIVQRLEHAEASLMAAAAQRGAAMTILRPTLVYGSGRDVNLSRIAAIARRLRCFVLPGDATGLRQPVHVEDLAEAAVATQAVDASHGRIYTLAGGEVLPYREMVRRVLQALEPPRPLWVIPSPLFRAVLWAARKIGIAAGFGDAAFARLRDDLAFDNGPARRDFGYAPRPFRPTSDMFIAPDAERDTHPS